MEYDARTNEFTGIKPGSDIYKAATIRTILSSIRAIHNFKEQLNELDVDGGEKTFISYVANRLASFNLQQIEFLSRRAPFTTLADFGRLLETAAKVRN